jgi:ribosomal protein S18 acetylase RimI-like enzyme
MVRCAVRPARAQDLPAIVAIHQRAFRGFFLTLLGARFLAELYRGYLQRRSGRLLVADVDGSVAGFAAGTLAPERFFRELLAGRWFVFGWAGLGAALSRPKAVVPRLLAAVRYRGDQPPQLQRAALLSSIAVDPSAARAGIGGMLLAAYCEEAWKENLRYVYLITDRDANDMVNRFYVRHGFAVDSELRRRDGRMMIRYVYERPA